MGTWYGKRLTVTKVVFDPSFAAYRPKQCGCWFYYFAVLAAVDGLTNLDTSVATNMAYMFCGCLSLTTLNLASFYTAKVTDMSSMFEDCSSLTTLDVSGFDTAKYAVELVWRGEQLFAGHVTRTWKGLVDGKSANLTASGTAEVK